MPNVDPDQRLNTLFGEYRESVSDPDPSANFMPELWGRIERRRTAALSFRRLSRVFVAASATVSFALGLLVLNAPQQPAAVVYQSTYIETLTETQPAEQVVEYADATAAGEPLETDLI